MAGTFTSSTSYSLSGHTFTYDKINLYVRQGSTLVGTHKYADVSLAMKIISGNFHVGSLSFTPSNSFFTRTVPFNNLKAGVVFQPSTNKVIGTDDTGSEIAIKQTYNISGSSGAVSINHNTTTHVLSMICACDPEDCTGTPPNPNYVQVN